MWLNAHEPTKLTPCSARRLCAAGWAASVEWASTPIQTAIPRAATARHTRMGASLERNVWGIVRALSACCRDRLPRGLELLGREPDVGMAAEAARPDAGGLDRRRLAEPADGQQWPEREAPAPAVAGRVVLRVADDLHDREDVLPAGRVADGQIALLHGRPAAGGVRPQRRRVDLVGEEPSGCPANEEPVLHRRFLTRPGYARRIRA